MIVYRPSNGSVRGGDIMGVEIVPPDKEQVCRQLSEHPDGDSRLKFMEQLSKLWSPGNAQDPGTSPLGIPYAKGSGWLELTPLDSTGDKFGLSAHDRHTGKTEELVKEKYGKPDPKTGKRPVLESTCDEPTS